MMPWWFPGNLFPGFRDLPEVCFPCNGEPTCLITVKLFLEIKSRVSQTFSSFFSPLRKLVRYFFSEFSSLMNFTATLLRAILNVLSEYLCITYKKAKNFLFYQINFCLLGGHTGFIKNSCCVNERWVHRCVRNEKVLFSQLPSSPCAHPPALTDSGCP